MEPLKLVPLEVGSDRLLLPAHLDELAEFATPKEPRYTLVGPIDAIALLRRDLAGIVDAVDAKRKWPAEKGMVAPGTRKDLPCHAIMDRGRVVYDGASSDLQNDPARLEQLIGVAKK